MEPAPRIQRATLAEQIETHIRDLIVSDRLGPGESLPSSTDLAGEFGVSRSIIREAMKSLQAKGLIEIANGKRARVRPISNSVLVDFFDRFAQPHKEAIIEMLELRKGIEVQGAVLAAQRRTADDLETIWRHLGAMEAKIGDLDAFTDADIQLHLAIVAASKNRMLFHVAESIREVMRDTMEEGLMRHTAPADWEKIQANHVTLVKLIDQQDAAGAGACMASHLDEAIHGIRTREPKTQKRASSRGPTKGSGALRG